MRRATGVTVGLQIAKYTLNLTALIILARLLKPSDYGLIAMSTAAIGIAAVLGDFGLSLAALRAEELSTAQKNNLFWLNTGIGVISAGFVAAASPLIGIFFNNSVVGAITLALSITFLLNALAVQFKVDINRDSRFLALGLIDLIAQGIAVLAGVLAALFGWSYWALVVQQVVNAGGALIFSILLSRWRPGLPRRGVSLISHLRFGRDTLALQLANYATENIDSIALGRGSGSGPLGLYNRAFQIVVLPLNQVMAPLTRVYLPFFSKAYVETRLAEALLAVQSKVIVGIVGPIALLGAVAPVLIPVLLGPDWGISGLLISILAIGGAFQALGYVYYWAFLALGKTGKLFASELWGRVPMVILIVSLAPLGAVPVAWSVVFGQVAIWVTGSFFYGPRAGLPVALLLRSNMRGLFAIVLATSITTLLRCSQVLGFGLGCVAALTISWGLVALAVTGCTRSGRSELLTGVHAVKGVLLRLRAS